MTLAPEEVDVAALLASGVACLHASAVSDGTRVVAFAGPSGAGKSTLAAALVDAGWRLVTDDILPVHVATGRARPVASPLRLVNGGDDKHERAAPAEVRDLELVRVWFVDPTDRGPQAHTPLDGAGAVMALVAVMPDPHPEDALDEAMRFEAAVALARRVRCARLRLPPAAELDLDPLVAP